MIKKLKDVYVAFFGRRHHWARHESYVNEVIGAKEALAILDKKSLPECIIEANLNTVWH